MISIAIVEDEKEAQDALVGCIEKYGRRTGRSSA